MENDRDRTEPPAEEARTGEEDLVIPVIEEQLVTGTPL
jgi:hypothetical protein